MEDSASSSDAVPRPRKHNCTYPVQAHSIALGQLQIREKPQYLQRLFRLLNQESVVVTDEFGLMSDLKLYLKLTSRGLAVHQADIQSLTHQAWQSASIKRKIFYGNSGRVRSYTQQIASDPAFVPPKESLLSQQSLVNSQQVNRDAKSVVVAYQPAIYRSSRQQMPRVLTSSLIPSMGIAA